MPSGSQQVTPKAAVEPETPPDAAVPEPAIQPVPDGTASREDGPAPIPTGFPAVPEPAAAVVVPESQQKESRPGYVTLAVQPPMESLTVPPLEGGGQVVIITAAGTEVDEGTALRAHEAARLAGFALREI